MAAIILYTEEKAHSELSKEHSARIPGFKWSRNESAMLLSLCITAGTPRPPESDMPQDDRLDLHTSTIRCGTAQADGVISGVSWQCGHDRLKSLPNTHTRPAPTRSEAA